LDTWLGSHEYVARKAFFMPGPLMLQQARCYDLLGRKPDAIRKSRDAIAIARIQCDGNDVFYPALYKEARSLLRGLETEARGVEDLWRMPAQFKPIPAHCRIYMIPLGDVDMAIVNSAGRNAAEFFGTNVVITPVVPVPRTALKINEFVLDAQSLRDELVKSGPFPRDALFVAWITAMRTDLSIPDRIVTHRYTPDQGNPVVISYHHNNVANGDENVRRAIKHIVDEMGWLMFNAAASQSALAHRQREPCTQFPCLRSEPQPSGHNCFSSLCPSCQAQYNAMDFDAMHRTLMGYLTTAGAKLVSPEEMGGHAGAAKP